MCNIIQVFKVRLIMPECLYVLSWGNLDCPVLMIYAWFDVPDCKTDSLFSTILNQNCLPAPMKIMYYCNRELQIKEF